MSDLSFPDKTRQHRSAWREKTAAAMRKTAGDRRAAARILGISVETIHKRINTLYSEQKREG